MLDGCTPWPDHLAEKYRDRGYWRDRPLGEVFADSVERYADEEALVFEDERVTYREMGDRVEELARSFLDRDVGLYDRVVVQLGNRSDFVYTYFALVRIGAIPVLALLPHRETEIGHFIEKTDAVAYVVPGSAGNVDYLGMAREMAGTHDTIEHVFVSGEAPEEFVALDDLDDPGATGDDLAARSSAIDPGEPAVFQLSGGTTGIPKVIPRTHNDYVYNSERFAEVHGMSEDTTLLVVIPVAHNFALASPGIQGVFFNGGRVVLSESKRPDRAIPLVDREEVTHVELVPALLIRWLDEGPFADHDVSSVEVVNTGGQRLQPEVYRRAGETFPNATVQEVFGMAEGLLCSPRLDDPEEVLVETVGRPMCPDDEVRLVDREGNEVPEGETGELVCQGPYTIRGYYRSPEVNRESFTDDGFFKTGDLMRRHPSGNLVVEGRVKDQINRGGEMISAEEVENLILGHPRVKNVACVPYSDDVLGERMCACIVVEPGGEDPTLDDVVSYLEDQRIAKFKLPERLELVDEIPVVSGFNKVDKAGLREMVERNVAAESGDRP